MNLFNKSCGFLFLKDVFEFELTLNRCKSCKNNATGVMNLFSTIKSSPRFNSHSHLKY